MKKDNTPEAPICECDQVHPQAIEKSREYMPSEEELYSLCYFFKLLGDRSRTRILLAIANSPMCVCDIAALLGMTKSAVSHQLKILRQSNLVRYKKSGKNVYYSLADDHVCDVVLKALEHIKE